MKALARVITALVVAVVVAGLIVGGLIVIYGYNKEPLPLADRCTARVADETIPLDLDQAHYASIITGVATQRALAPRASTIAIATAYQESGIDNLDYGDRDSLGLFQQRPSQGWGTQQQVMDPWYASNSFYAALVKVPNWATGDVNDVAQAVQRSGHPNGYARHVESARRVASALTGETPASFTCVAKSPAASNPVGFKGFLTQTLPPSSRLTERPGVIVVSAPTPAAAWSAAHITVANASRFGVTRVAVAGMTWTPSRTSLAPWEGTKTTDTTVEITFAVAPTPSSTP